MGNIGTATIEAVDPTPSVWTGARVGAGTDTEAGIGDRADLASDPDLGPRTGIDMATGIETGVTVRGLIAKKLLLVALTLAFAVAAFAGGHNAAERLSADDTDVSALPPTRLDRPNVPLTIANPSESSQVPATPAINAPVETLRFVALDEPTVLIEAETDPELNNSLGVDVAAKGQPNAAAIVADFELKGPGGSIVSIHPGDRPADGLRFTIPEGGRLLVPHLVAATDSNGRIGVAADQQVKVKVSGIGTFVPAGAVRAGRFISTGSQRVGSLVTATDGRRLVVDLSEAVGDDSEFVGQAVIRLNANIGKGGGSISVDSGDPIPWPAPASQDFGLAGTELLTVTPNSAGEIVFDYLGGSVLTVDLVGYYTNEAAPETEDGLLVLLSTPELQQVQISEDDVGFSIESESLALDGEATRAVATVEVTNADSGGSVAFWNEQDQVPSSPAFALSKNQRRSTTEWFDQPASSEMVVRGPDGASLQIWLVGFYR